MALTGITAAAIPAGWIALKHVPAQGEESGYWVLVKEPADGLLAWWSDEELAKIIAGDEDYVQRLETDWSPDDHPVASATEATQLAAELAKHWEGDLPQANYWAHGALTRRGDLPQAFRWELDGLAQRTTLEQSGKRPEIPAAALDPDPVDQRYGNRADIVTYGERWGSHLRTGTIDHVYTAERNKAQRRHHPNPPPSGEVARKARETVRACREASLETEMGVFENYVRGWGGLGAKTVTFGMPANCISDPGPLLAQAPPPVRRPVAPPVTYTACDGSKHRTRAAANAVSCGTTTSRTRRYTACDGSKHRTRAAANAVSCGTTTSRTRRYTACDGSKHRTRAAANAVSCGTTTSRTRRYTACDGSKHATRTAARAVSCETDPEQEEETESETFEACDGSEHASRAAARAVNCAPPPPQTNKPNGGSNRGGGNPGGGNGGGGNGGGGGGDPPPDDYEACDGSTHSTQAAANAISCPDPDTEIEHEACDGSMHSTMQAADAVSCDPPAITPDDDPQYTACDGTLHYSQEDADAIPCYGEETDSELNDEYCQSSFEPGCNGF